MKKIDWDKVWEKYDAWYDKDGWHRFPVIYPNIRHRIQSLVEAQLKVKRKK